MAKSETWTATYRCAEPLITKRDVEKIKKKATLRQRFRLLFRPAHVYIDGKSIIRCKKMDGIYFVMKRGTKL